MLLRCGDPSKSTTIGNSRAVLLGFRPRRSALPLPNGPGASRTATRRRQRRPLVAVAAAIPRPTQRHIAPCGDSSCFFFIYYYYFLSFFRTEKGSRRRRAGSGGRGSVKRRDLTCLSLSFFRSRDDLWPSSTSHPREEPGHKQILWGFTRQKRENCFGLHHVWLSMRLN